MDGESSGDFLEKLHCREADCINKKEKQYSSWSDNVIYIACVVHLYCVKINYLYRICGKCWLTAYEAKPHMTPPGAYWHLSLPPLSLLFQNATTSIHFQSALSNGNNWFLPLLHKWNKLVIKHFVSKSKFRDQHQHFGRKKKEANSLKQKQEVAKDVWGEKEKGGAGNEIMNGVRVSYLSQAERH